MNFKKEFKSVSILLIIFLISLVIILFLSKVTDYLNGINSLNFIFYFFCYLGSLLLTGWLYNKFPIKVLKYLYYGISFPILILFLLIKFARPTMWLLLNGVLFIISCFIIPTILLRLNNYFEYFNLAHQTTMFIKLTFASCVSVTLPKQILYIIYRFGPYGMIENKSFKKITNSKIIDLTNEILNKENIRFIIYTLFFVYLLVFSFQYLQNSTIFEIGEKDRAVYQSFLCFLAFDRLLLNSKRIILIPSRLLNKVMNSMRDDEEE